MIGVTGYEFARRTGAGSVCLSSLLNSLELILTVDGGDEFCRSKIMGYGLAALKVEGISVVGYISI